MQDERELIRRARRGDQQAFEMLVGLKVTAGAGTVPVPLSTTVCGLPGALLATVTAALLAPAESG